MSWCHGWHNSMGAMDGPLFLSYRKIHSNLKSCSEVYIVWFSPFHDNVNLRGFLGLLGVSSWLGNFLRPCLMLPLCVTVCAPLVIVAMFLSYVGTHIYNRRAGNRCSDKARRYPQDQGNGRWWAKKSCQISNLELDITQICVIIVICWRYTVTGVKRRTW